MHLASIRSIILCLFAAGAEAAVFAAPAAQVAPATPVQRPDASAPPASGPTDAEVDAARREVAALEREAFAKNPRLRDAERVVAETVAAWQADGERHGRVERELFARAKTDRHARHAYRNLAALWAASLEPLWLADARRQPVLRNLIMARDVRADRVRLLKREAPDLARGDLAGDDAAFWDAYVEWLGANKAKFVERFDAAARDSGLGAFLVEQAKRQGEFEFTSAAYSGFAFANRPPELSAARERLRKLEIAAHNARVFPPTTRPR